MTHGVFFAQRGSARGPDSAPEFMVKLERPPPSSVRCWVSDMECTLSLLAGEDSEDAANCPFAVAVPAEQDCLSDNARRYSCVRASSPDLDCESEFGGRKAAAKLRHWEGVEGASILSEWRVSGWGPFGTSMQRLSCSSGTVCMSKGRTSPESSGCPAGVPFSADPCLEVGCDRRRARQAGIFGPPP